mmetsp:Transcript_3249/g.4428  ORF Transcript_3249/g.4428 Transcript_3249/m.4428 type:complete len:98 (+) Transcript_3249:928-1221(+)
MPILVQECLCLIIVRYCLYLMFLRCSYAINIPGHKILDGGRNFSAVSMHPLLFRFFGFLFMLWWYLSLYIATLLDLKDQRDHNTTPFIQARYDSESK